MRLYSRLLMLPIALVVATSQVQAADLCRDTFIVSRKTIQTQAKPSFVQANFNVVREEGPDLGKINLKMTKSESLVGKMANFLTNLTLHKALGVGKIAEVAKRFLEDKSDRPYFIRLADAYKLKIDYDPSLLETVPKTGPLIIVANHPMNGVDGIALAAMISQVRPDVKVVLTKFLEDFPDMKDNSILVNPYGGQQAKRENLQKKVEMDEHLQKGGVIVIFPSGTVSQKTKLSDSYATDPVWYTGVAQMLKRNPGTSVLPIFVEGQPSQRYQVGVKIGGVVQMVLHIREISSRIQSNVALTIGKTLSGDELLAKFDPQTLMNHLRILTYMQSIVKEEKKNFSDKKMEEIAAAIDPSVLVEELNRKAVTIFQFAPERADKGMKTFFAERGEEIPQTLKELGSVRERTFRLVNEGSGKSRDNDDYDEFYGHLISWDKAKNVLTGAYRIGFIDRIIEQHGISGVYTDEFFEHGRLINKYKNHALELGRAVVLPEYQRRSFALPALWGGIGELVVRNPHYRYLLGPVSISAEYSQASQLVITAYLMSKHASADAKLVRARSPMKIDTVLRDNNLQKLLEPIKDLEQLDALVKFLENDKNKGLPPLIKMYGELGAQYLGFNVDKAFNSIDGLIVVDLAKAPESELVKYLGKEGSASYLKYWQQPENKK